MRIHDIEMPAVGDTVGIELDQNILVETTIVEYTDGQCVCESSAAGWLALEAKYKGREVQLGKPIRGGSKKSYVYVRNPESSKVIKVSFGDPNMRIKKHSAAHRKSFRARHRCSTAKDRTTARYWACKSW